MTNIIKITEKRDIFNFEELQDFIQELEPYLDDLRFLASIKNNPHINDAAVKLEICIEELKQVMPFNEI